MAKAVVVGLSKSATIRATYSVVVEHFPYGVFHKWGYPKLWMVFVMKNPAKLDDLRVPPHFRRCPYLI